MNNEKECLFKVGDIVYAEQIDGKGNNDHRELRFCPSFKVAEISHQGLNIYYLRPEINKIGGILSDLCIRIETVEDAPPKLNIVNKKAEEDRKLITDYLKFIKDTDYSKISDGIEDFLEQYYE